MKKIVTLAVLLGLLSAFPFNAKAEGIEAGQHMWALSVGAATAFQKAGYDASDMSSDYSKSDEMEWGKRGGVLGLSYNYFPSEYFGIGLEANDGFFGGDEYKVSKAGHDYKIDTGMNVFSAMATLRFNVNPHNKVRFYVPAGMGYSWSTNLMVVEDKFGGKTKKDTYHTTSGSLSYFAGLGLEIDLGKHWSLGGEARFHAFVNDTDKVAKEIGDKHLIGKKEYSYASVAFRASYRF